MSDATTQPLPPPANETEYRARLQAAAARALAEAAQRRIRRHPAAAPSRPREVGGPAGPEPTRYGDWERNGVISDF